MNIDDKSVALFWSLMKASNPAAMVDAAVEYLRQWFAADSISAFYISQNQEPLVRTKGSAKQIATYDLISRDQLTGSVVVTLTGTPLFLPLFESDTERTVLAPNVGEMLSSSGVHSYALVSMSFDSGEFLVFELQFQSRYHQFRKSDQDIFSSLHLILKSWFQNQTIKNEPSKSEVDVHSFEGEYAKLLKHGNLIIIRTDPELHVTDVVGDTSQLFGIDAAGFLNRAEVWTEFLHPQDRKKLIASLNRGRVKVSVVDAEVRIVHQKNAVTRWISLRAVPITDSVGKFIGWEGFGVDITERKLVEERLERSRSRLHTLYQVTQGVAPTMEPAQVVTRGLQSLAFATRASEAFVALMDKNSEALEIVATIGISESEMSILDKEVRSNRFFALVHSRLAEPTILESSKAISEFLGVTLPAQRGILVPISEGDTLYGVLGLFTPSFSQLRVEDSDLSIAVGRQLALTIRHAEHLVEEREGTAQISVLYRLSHELSKYLTPREIAEHSFPIIQEEFPCKRIWIGTTNEQRTHIAGQAATGPGMRAAIARAQIELELRHDFLDEALRTQLPVIVPVGAPKDCSGFNRLMERLKPGLMIIVPLVSLGQSVGVIVLEPAATSQSAAQRKLPLLTRMAGEIATVLLARRFESKIADADKMRMAGVLASGVAHNFNNLLQAVMGQASLIEMQSSVGSSTARSAKMIMEAATRGASMVAQLLTFSSGGTTTRESLEVNQLLHESMEFYRSILGKGISFSLDLEAEVPAVHGNYSQVQQALTNLLLNAKDAVSNQEEPKVVISTRSVRLKSGEVDPELPPGQYIRIDVEDNGVGMTLEQQRRCFEPFYTSKKPGSNEGANSGVGLGLSSAYSLIKNHFGSIVVESSPRQGSKFSVYLPIPLRATSEDHAKEELEVPVCDVLIVGEDERFIDTVKVIIESMGLTAQSTNQALSSLKAMKEQNLLPSVVIVDADTAEQNGDSVIDADIEESIRVLIATEDLQKWEGKIPPGSKQFRLFRKPFGAWSIYAALSGFAPKNDPTPLAKLIEKQVTPATSSSFGRIEDGDN